MKLILSRKGFDSGVANCGSPIMPDERMVSLPIPLSSATTSYQNIIWCGESLGPIVESLSGGTVSAELHAHLDPDLSADALPRLQGWRPSFGQTGASQSHLKDQDVREGDLFLFYGWFQRTDETGRRFRRNGPDEHILFGWLQIGEILSVKLEFDRFSELYPWLAKHPHLEPGTSWNRSNNTIYVATERLVLDGRDMGVPGGGTFRRFHPGLRLTEPGKTRVNWLLPGWLHPEQTGGMSYNTSRSRWGDQGDTVSLKSASQGQEFVSTVNSGLVAKWVDGLLTGCQNAAVNLDPEF